MKKGFTLLELMIVVFIFTFLFAALLTVMSTSDRSWRTGQHKLTVQQEARKAMDTIVKLLRQTNPDWDGTGTYNVTITSNNRIDFYKPVFDAAGNYQYPFPKITFKLNPSKPTQLLKNEGSVVNPVVIANNIESINFGGGCPGCAAFNCSPVATDCPVVSIDIQTKDTIQTGQDIYFNLSSQVALRNTNPVVGIEVEEPQAGEF